MGRSRPVARRLQLEEAIRVAASRGQPTRQESPRKRQRLAESEDISYDPDFDFGFEDDTASVFPADLDAEELSSRLQEYANADENSDEPSFDQLNNLRQLADYQSVAPEEAGTEAIVEFDEHDDTISPDTLVDSPPSTATMMPPSRRSSLGLPLDTSVPVPHQRSIHSRSKFIIALGLWAEETGLSRTHYSSLLEILRMLQPNEEISKLPESLGTLKKWLKEQLPLLQLRTKSIPLLPEKLPSMKASLKASQPNPTENLYFFDPPHLFSTFLSSPVLRNKMHLGLAEFVDSPTQLWHSHAWASSIRTSSGHYAHIPATNETIFPSDFVQHRCLVPDCQCQQGDQDQLHLGRVFEVGKDYRSSSPFPQGSLVLRIQKVANIKEWRMETTTALDPPIVNSELILYEDQIFELQETSV
ncbi:MAG: hypothetical protein Q9200_006455, partial [Gallowayella weberi]